MLHKSRFICFISLLFLFFSSGVSGAKTSEECDRKKVDKCNEKLFMIGLSTFVFPSNMGEMNARCKDVKTLESCIKNFAAKCLTNDAKQAVSVLLYGVTKTNKFYCSSTKRKQQLITAAKCLQTNKPRLDTEMQIMSKKFAAIVGYSDDKLKIPLACCQYYKFKETTISHITNKCSERQAQEYEYIVNGYAQDVLNVFCGEYTEDSDKCSKIIDRIPKTKPKPNLNVFVMPMVDIFESLPKVILSLI